MSPSTWVWLLFVPLMTFALYRRLRRTFGRQRVRTRRMVFRMAMLTLIAAVIVGISPIRACFVAAAAGVVLGLGLALLGLGYTRYEVNEDGRFYTSNGWIGLAVTALFLARMVARLATLSMAMAASPTFPTPFSGVQRSPLTVGVFLVMASYYVVYYAGVLRAVRVVTPTP